MDSKAIWILYTKERTSLNDCIALRSLKSEIKPEDTVYVYSITAGKILYRTSVTELGEGSKYNLLHLHIDERYLGKRMEPFDQLLPESEPEDKNIIEITENSPLLMHFRSEFEEGQARFVARKNARERNFKESSSDNIDSDTIHTIIMIIVIAIGILLFFYNILFAIFLFIGLTAMVFDALRGRKL